jgi:truncated hemoglobin YjbI
MRHATFPIDDAMRDRWLLHMNYALDTVAAPAELIAEMRDYVVRAADHLRNV